MAHISPILLLVSFIFQIIPHFPCSSRHFCVPEGLAMPIRLLTAGDSSSSFFKRKFSLDIVFIVYYFIFLQTYELNLIIQTFLEQN